MPVEFFKAAMSYYRRTWIKFAYLALSFLLVCRIIASYYIPLNDTTEARYGEIARNLLASGNWVTLQQDYGVPFWAKPPLSSWLSAASMMVFGINEFALRLPSLLLSLGILYLVWDLAKRQTDRASALVSTLVLASTVAFFLDAGTVMTDPALLFCITLAITSFWHALSDRSPWSYWFFVALGLGLLAKGPLVLVLVGLPLFFWTLIRHEWSRLWHKLPWIKGTLIMCLIALPWYVLAELRTPGFLNYFIVGEHWHRFLTPGWSGDKYGFAHQAPRGIIWFYAVVGFLPWSMIAICWMVNQRKKLTELCKDDNGWSLYLTLCMLMPLLFFTFSGNVIYPYVFPALPAFALIFGEMWWRSRGNVAPSFGLTPLILISALGALLVTGLFKFKPDLIAKNQKKVVQMWKAQHPQPQSVLIYWNSIPEFSAQFYSSGKVYPVSTLIKLCEFSQQQILDYMIVNYQDLAALSSLAVQHSPVKTFNLADKNLVLTRILNLPCSTNKS